MRALAGGATLPVVDGLSFDARVKLSDKLVPYAVWSDDLGYVARFFADSVRFRGQVKVEVVPQLFD